MRKSSCRRTGANVPTGIAATVTLNNLTPGFVRLSRVPESSPFDPRTLSCEMFCKRTNNKKFIVLPV